MTLEISSSLSLSRSSLCLSSSSPPSPLWFSCSPDCPLEENQWLFIERVHDLIGLIHESIHITWSIREDHCVALRSNLGIHRDVFSSKIQLRCLLTCAIFRNSCRDLLNCFTLSFSILNNCNSLSFSLWRERERG
jgi:hypothetical protein